MRNRQYLGCLRVRERHADPRAAALRRRGRSSRPASCRLGCRRSAKRELDLARDIIKGLAGTWRPEQYQDTYTKALRAVVKQKVAGHDVHAAAEPEPEDARRPDGSAAAERRGLKATEAKRRARPRRSKRPRRPSCGWGGWRKKKGGVWRVRLARLLTEATRARARSSVRGEVEIDDPRVDIGRPAKSRGVPR